MVKRSLNDWALFVIGLVAIVGVLNCHVAETSWVRYEKEVARKRPLYREEVTETEVEELARLWPKFLQEPFAQDMMVSYHTESVRDALTWRIKMWFRYCHWDANRFFYVQQRIVEILKELELRNNARAVIKLLSARINDPAVAEMIKVQKQRLKQKTYSEAELKIIEDRQEKLRKIFLQPSQP